MVRADVVPLSERVAVGRWKPSIYFVVGQAAWFACVIGAAHDLAWIGVVFAIALFVLHVALSARPFDELKLAAAIAMIGGLWDTAVIHAKLLDYPHGMLVGTLAPGWIFTLWALFAAQFNTTYRWLKSRLWIGALLGAVAGPLSFRAGAALGAVQFINPKPALFTLAVGWAVLIPTITLLSKRWDGVQSA